MTFLYIIIGIVVLAIFKFVSDSNKVTKENSRNGGLITKHRNFVSCCANPLSTTQMELVKNSGKHLEYRLPVQNKKGIEGYFHLGIEDTFTVIIYCFAISVNGTKHKGFQKEIANWRSMGSDDYDKIFETMVMSMMSTDEFAELNFS